MNKIESLKKLVERISQEDVVMAGGIYRHTNGGKCNNCVIGHMLLMADKGVNQSILSDMDNGDYSIGAMAYSIDMIIDKQIAGRTPNDLIKDSLESLGFDLVQDVGLLQKLQNVNDKQGKKALIEHINFLIEELEYKKENA